MIVKKSPSMESRQPLTSEDELFERLKSDPYDRLCFQLKERFGGNSPSQDDLRAFLKEHGWTMTRWIRKRMST